MQQEDGQKQYRKKKGIARRLGKFILLFFGVGLVMFLIGAVFLGVKKMADSMWAVFVVEQTPSERKETEEAYYKPPLTKEVEWVELEDSRKEIPWNLTLVNEENPLSKDFAPEELAEANNTYYTDSRIAEAVKEMIADARGKYGVRIIALSGYRDYEYQKELFDDKVKRIRREKKCSLEEAKKEAATVVALPGTSEHQLGLSLDLVDARHVNLDETQEDTPAYKWLCEHCAEYGFIVRYPNGKTDVTGIIYEPWHFRYVGKEAAEVIMEEGITLEEYLEEYFFL